MKYIFPLLFLGVFTLQIWLIWKLWFSHCKTLRHHQKTIKIVLGSLYCLIILYLVGRYTLTLPQGLYYIASLAIGIIFFLFCGALIYAFSGLTLIPFSQQRRDALLQARQLGTLMLTTSYATAAGVEGIQPPQLTHTPIKIKNLNHPLKIVQISDMHIGGLIQKEYVEEIVNRINALEADLIAITGDLTDADYDSIASSVEPLGNLSSRYGTFFIPGNHEYFHGLEKTLDSLERLGITNLLNQHTLLYHHGQTIQLVGVKDIFGYRRKQHEPNLKQAMAGCNPDHPTILLAHQPKFVFEAEKFPIDLMLSGHTHGGQIFPFHLLVKLQQPYLAGLYRHNLRLQVYVSRGSGFWGPPMRILAPSEISLLHLS